MIAYFDNCATTKVDEDVIDLIAQYHKNTYFNPSARSSYSLLVSNDIAKSRQNVAKALGVTAQEIIFTSGGTESINMGIFGSIRAKKGNVVVTQAEHSAVFNSVCELSNRGYEIRIAKVFEDGHIDVDDFVSKVDEQTVLACFMHVNNETGAINDAKTINALVKAKNQQTVTFCDGVQAFGKIPVNVRYLGVDLYSISGHKFHCSKGTGCLFVKNGLRFGASVFGGGQERGFRSGTEYVGGVVALGVSMQRAVNCVDKNTEKFLKYKEIIRNSLADIADWRENCTQNVSPAIMSLAFADIKGEVLLHMLEIHEIIVGTGSACSSKNKQSRIAKAIGLPLRFSEGVIRISFSKNNSTEQVQFLADKLALCVRNLRKTMLG